MTKPKNPNFSHEAVLAAFDYDKSTGVFTWRISNNQIKIGGIAGSLMSDGYRRIIFMCHRIPAHRLAWFYVHSVWPKPLDHKNGVRDDNRFSNLREATPQQNCRNRRQLNGTASGIKGVTKVNKSNKWRARIHVDGAEVNLGTFCKKKEAESAYHVAAKKHFGQFWRAA